MTSIEKRSPREKSECKPSVLGGHGRNMRAKPLPANPRSDPINYEKILDRQDRRTLRDEWLDYVKTAVRPYAYGTFKWRFQQWTKEREQKSLSARTSQSDGDLLAASVYPTADEFVASERYWRSKSLPKARILCPRSGVTLRVSQSVLHITETLPLHLSPDGEPFVTKISTAEARASKKERLSALIPKAIILPEHGWTLTAESLKFCLAHKIALISVAGRTSQGEKGLISVIAADPVADAQLVRAQTTATAIAIAREIVRQKLETIRSQMIMSAKEFKTHWSALNRATTLQQIMRIESLAAASYWSARQCEIKTAHGFRSSKRWPPEWSRFTTRNSPLGSKGPRYAVHPVNALLNWSYAVVAGRLSAHLFARGACLSIGYLHTDLPGRYSLAYDAIELLRPLIDEKVFAFVAKNRFRIGDFLISDAPGHKGELRCSQELLRVFGPATFLPEHEIERAADWMVEAIQTLGGRKRPAKERIFLESNSSDSKARQVTMPRPKAASAPQKSR